MTEFYYLKLGNGNCLAEYWLNLEEKRPNVYNRPAVAIYFGTITAKKISELSKLSNKEEAKKQFRQLTISRDLPKGNQDFSAVEDFIRAGDNLGNTTFITITGSKLYIYEPDSRVSDMPKDKCEEYDKKLDELSQNNTAWTKKNIEGMKIKFEKPERLFSVDVRFEDELNKDIISEELKGEFKKNKSFLSNKGTITKEKEEWEITGEKIYCIKKEDGKLSIHSKIRHIPKIMLVKHCNGYNNGYNIAEVPHVLATLPCNQRYTRGTCRKIDAKKDWGAIQAIKHVLGQEKIKVSEDKLFELLSPYELETLVFLILKNAGLFVPAWRGGTQKDFDIIARNLANKQIKISSIKFEPKDSFTFQVKKKIPNKVDADFLVVGTSIGNDDEIPESIKREKILDAKWLLKQIKEKNQRDTKKWFENSLDWVENMTFGETVETKV